MDELNDLHDGRARLRYRVEENRAKRDSLRVSAELKEMVVSELLAKRDALHRTAMDMRESNERELALIGISDSDEPIL